MTKLDTSTPVLVLGGMENALSLTRGLGALGIPVRVSGIKNCWGLYSRFCRQAITVPDGRQAEDYWAELLLTNRDGTLDGHILIACNDDALEFLAVNKAALAEHYILDEFKPDMILAMLDKQKTLQISRKAGVPTPNFWKVKTLEDVAKIEHEIVFPVMVKPIHTHLFNRQFGCKLFIIKDSFSELLEKAKLALDSKFEIMVVEMIPGPDDLLSSYYTYIDGAGNQLFHFTKRVLRRYPVNAGGTCYHITEWLPETAELGNRFFQKTGFVGMGNIEFKRDTRDGQLKIIEVNSRFTAAQELVRKCGMPLDIMLYRHLTNQPDGHFREKQDFENFHRLWYPLNDFMSYRQLSKRGELSLAGWIKSILAGKKIFPVFSWRDPKPFLIATIALKDKLKKK